MIIGALSQYEKLKEDVDVATLRLGSMKVEAMKGG